MQALGMTLKMPTLVEANDISRWCTVWSLLERGTYVIDDCPWQKLTQDKVYDHNPWEKPPEQGERPRHFYSTKPPLLPTIIAGLIYPFRAISGIPLDRETLQQRITRKTLLDTELPPGPGNLKTETPEPYKWPMHILYLKPILILFNVLPLAAFLVLYARLLDRLATNDWAWYLCLFAAAWGSQLFIFSQTLNNHTIAAYSGFFATYALLQIIYEGRKGPGLFVAAGFFGAFCACNELPAALFGVLLFLILLIREPKRTLVWFVPAAAIVCLAFLATQYIVGGSFMPKYKEFGTKSYEYEGSYWQTPLEMDALREPKWLYLFHMTFGHHGVFSLTPIFLFSVWGGLKQVANKSAPRRGFAFLVLALSLGMLVFYAYMTNNYGGSTQGLRWMFWLFPFWLILLPMGLDRAADSRAVRYGSLGCLLLSILSVGYGARQPWSHPWILDALEHLKLYSLKR